MKTYECVGTQPLDLNDFTLHVEPGDRFDAELDINHESFLIRIGAIVVVNGSQVETKPQAPAMAGAVLTPEQAAQRLPGDGSSETFVPMAAPVSQDTPVPMPPAQATDTADEVPQAKSVRGTKK